MSRPEFIALPRAATAAVTPRPLPLRKPAGADVAPLDQKGHEPIAFPKGKGAKSEAEKIRAAAQQFEAVFMSYLYKTMRATVPDSPFAEGGETQGMYEEMFTQSLGSSLAGDGSPGRGLGLAEMLVKHLEPKSAQAALSRALHSEIIGSSAPGAAAGGLTAAAPDRLSVEKSSRARKEIPALADNVRMALDQAAEATGVDRKLLHAMALVESGGNPQAESRRGARGLMQLMAGTARELGVKNVFDPIENALAGARYLKRMLLNNGGDERLALASYNAGPGNVRRHGGVPPFKETIHYIERVLDMRQKLGGGTT